MTITQAAPWWRTAPNPPCVSWCEGAHEPGEFSHGGGMLCTKTIARNDDFAVEVQSFAFTDEDHAPGTYSIDPAGVWVEAAALSHEGVLTPAHARSMMLALTVATSEAAAVAEKTVRS